MRSPTTALCLASVTVLLASACQQIEFPDAEEQSPGTAQAGSTSRIDDAGTLGSAARAILGSDPFRRILVEIAYVEGRRPPENAVEHLTDVLSDVAHKPVRIEEYELKPGDGTYSASEIRRMAQQRRRRVSEVPDAAVWIGYLNGHLSSSDSAAGVAVSATAAAIFPDTLPTGPLATDDAIHRSVLVHEVGHILALVEIGYESEYDRHDPDHPHHSTRETSVMHWAVEQSAFDIFDGGPPDTFDEADRADLRKLRRSNSK